MSVLDPLKGFEGLTRTVNQPNDGFYPLVDGADNPSYVSHPSDSAQATDSLVAPRNRSLFFNQPGPNGKLLRIDYVLVFRQDADNASEESRRAIFQRNLTKRGLLLEEEKAIDGNLVAVKVHGTWPTLIKYAELMKMKMPLKEFGGIEEVSDDTCGSCNCFKGCPNPFVLDESIYKEDENYFTCLFRHDRLDLFLVNDEDTFFTNAERSRIVYEVMMRTDWEDGNTKGIGLRRLLGSGVYEAAYPLHEGPYDSDQGVGSDNDRHLLYELWGRPKRWYKHQPLDLVRKYFGERIAIYFTWLGLYTSMLIPVSIIGILVFLYGAATLSSYTPANDICNKSGAGNYTMCPLCDGVCTYDRLYSSCFYARLSVLVDNPLTILFAIIMSLWGTLFLEMWKRRQAELQYDWDVANYEEDEAVRPEYEAQCNYVRINPVTGDSEPYIPVMSQFPRYCISCATATFMILLVLCFLLGVIVYRVAMVVVFYSLGSQFAKYAKIVTSGTGAILNLLAILILNRIYRVVAIWLTNLERPRTETEYDSSLTFKMYCFQFVNFYSSLFYIAFFKGSFSGRPGDYNYAIGYRPEECDPSGCLMELCIQMIFIFVGKQIINNFVELAVPLLFNCYQRYKMRKMAEETEAQIYGDTEAAKAAERRLAQEQPQWEQDYPLQTVTHLSLFDEYLEMVIQFGFVTLFVSAFPLAPFFALLNNIIEIRLDAFKMLTQWRRPYATRAQDIGVWYNILNCVAVLGILSNAFIIGYTSDSIPRLVYRYYYNQPSNSLEGFVNFYLAQFNTSDFQNRSIPETVPASFGKVEVCRYRAFREPYYMPNKYQYTTTYWHIFTARFIFILLFEHLILFLTNVIAWMIPDMPEKLKNQEKRERYLAQEIMFKANEDALKSEIKDSLSPNEGNSPGHSSHF